MNQHISDIIFRAGERLRKVNKQKKIKENKILETWELKYLETPLCIEHQEESILTKGEQAQMKNKNKELKSPVRNSFNILSRYFNILYM